MQLLLPGVLLHCAASMPASSLHHQQARTAAQLSMTGVVAWSTLAQTCISSSGSCQQPPQQQPRLAQPQLQTAWVAELVPAALKLARRILPQLQEDEDIVTAAAKAGTANGISNMREGLQATAAVSTCASEAAECLQQLLTFHDTMCKAVASFKGPGAVYRRAGHFQ